MRDGALVRRADGVGKRNRDRQQPIQRHASGGDEGVERLALHQFHRQEQPALVLFDRVNRDDVGMIQRGDGSRFAGEALAAIRIGGDGVGQDLEGHPPAEFQVLGLVHLAHPARPKRTHDPVVREGRRNHSARTLSARMIALMPTFVPSRLRAFVIVLGVAVRQKIVPTDAAARLSTRVGRMPR